MNDGKSVNRLDEASEPDSQHIPAALGLSRALQEAGPVRLQVPEPVLPCSSSHGQIRIHFPFRAGRAWGKQGKQKGNTRPPGHSRATSQMAFQASESKG